MKKLHYHCIVKSDNHPIQYIWENQLFGPNLSFLYYTQPLIYFLKSSQTKGFTLTFSEYITFYWSIVWKILCKHWTSWETNPFSELLLYTTITANKITKRYYQQPVYCSLLFIVWIKRTFCQPIKDPKISVNSRILHALHMETS